MSWMTTPYLEHLERYLDLASLRQGLISSNVANIDTPGYRTKDIDFAGELQRALSTDGKAASPFVQNVKGLIERPDGNNVSVDRETLLMANTQMQFRLGAELARMELKRLQTAITEGR